jgi:hypothetical protein
LTLESRSYTSAIVILPVSKRDVQSPETADEREHFQLSSPVRRTFHPFPRRNEHFNSLLAAP